MSRHLIIAVSIWFLTPPLGSAAVFERDWLAPGDGLLTYDDVNQREWLDLTETQLFQFPGDTLEEQYQFVVSGTSSGGMFNGFAVATSNEVLALAESAGIDTSTLDFETNGFAINRLIDLLEETRDFGNSSPNRASSGLVSFADSTLVSTDILFGPGGRTTGFAGLEVTQFVGSDSGVWLYRAIPEPGSAWLGLACTILVCCSRYRRLFF
jgi:hypothetical protein